LELPQLNLLKDDRSNVNIIIDSSGQS